MFTKGQPPGPGRGKGTLSGATRAKQWAEKEGGWDLIIRMVQGIEPNFTRSAAVRADLAKYLIDRAYGKASQAVELSGPNGGPIDVRSLLLDLCADPAQLAGAQSNAPQIVEGKQNLIESKVEPKSTSQLEMTTRPIDGEQK